MTVACRGASKTVATWPCRANRHEMQTDCHLWPTDSAGATELAVMDGTALVAWCCAVRCRPTAKPGRLLGFAYRSDRPSPTHAESAKYEADWTSYAAHERDHDHQATADLGSQSHRCDRAPRATKVHQNHYWFFGC